MVYLGKPSRGCQTCKTRRIKCDEARPTCSQCAKSRRLCPGYKDEFDLVFRNETKATERRARKAIYKALSVKSKTQSPELLPPSVFTSQDSPDGPIRTKVIASPPPVPTSEKASCHFISNYVLLSPQGTERGYLEFIPSLMKNDPPAYLRLAFEACALASFGNSMGIGIELEKQALGKYTSALASISSAVQDPILFRKDATLAAVLLLGLFENITSRQLGMLAWGSHTEGAIHLVKNRGSEQLKTKIGRDMFVAVRTQMMIYSFSSGKPPALGADFWFQGDAPKGRIGTMCQNLTIRISELKTELNHLLMTLSRTPENIRAVKDMVEKCRARDKECIKWIDDLPPYFQYETIAWEDTLEESDYSTRELYPGRIDAFVDLWVASVWSMLRCSRIVLCSIIVRAAAWIYSPVDYRTTLEYATYSRIATNTIADIIASIPYQLGWFVKRQYMLKQADLTTYGCGENDAAKGLAGYFVTWPLSCVLTQDYSSESQRSWVKGRLNHVANVLGVRYAKMLIQLDLRIPSMLISRDNMAASGGDIPSTDFEKILSTRTVPPSGVSINPLQHRD